ncbi:MAG: hypothetical protein ACJAVZ_004531 [Afipia broomeae]|jgi:hypothetical protein
MEVVIGWASVRWTLVLASGIVTEGEDPEGGFGSRRRRRLEPGPKGDARFLKKILAAA